MSPTSSSISTPVSLAISSTIGAACSPSAPLPAPTSTPRMISVDSSSTTWTWWPSKRRDAGLAGVGVDLDILGHEGGQELGRLLGVLPSLHGLEQPVGGGDHAGELQGAGAGILPVDLGLGAREVAPQGSQQLLREARLPGGVDDLADRRAHQLVGVLDG